MDDTKAKDSKYCKSRQGSQNSSSIFHKQKDTIELASEKLLCYL
jgi:hypothetical protein